VQVIQLGKTWFSETSGGGSDRVFAALLRHLPDAKTSVQGLVVGSPPVNGSTIPGLTGVSTETASLWTRCRSIRRRVRKTLDQHPPDVVAAHFALYAAPVLDLVGDHPFIVHFHGPWAEESRMEGEGAWKVTAKALLEQSVYRRADHFVVLSEAFRKILVDDYAISPDRISIIPGGVDVEMFNTHATRREARAHLGWPPDRPTIVSVRRLVHRVGLEPLVRAMDQVRRRMPDALLCIAGKGPLRSTLAQLINDLNLTDHVRLLGFVPEADLPYVYRAGDVSIMPTQALEGFGLSAVESLAAGTPVLVTPVGGLPDIVTRLSDDLLMDGTDARALAEHVTAALDGSLRLPSDTDCRGYAARHFDWPVIAHQTRTLYRNLRP
jgi:glycosyltransferase involved in cell wall biosynthesis